MVKNKNYSIHDALLCAAAAAVACCLPCCLCCCCCCCVFSIFFSYKHACLLLSKPFSRVEFGWWSTRASFSSYTAYIYDRKTCYLRSQMIEITTTTSSTLVFSADLMAQDAARRILLSSTSSSFWFFCCCYFFKYSFVFRSLVSNRILVLCLKFIIFCLFLSNSIWCSCSFASDRRHTTYVSTRKKCRRILFFGHSYTHTRARICTHAHMNSHTHGAKKSQRRARRVEMRIVRVCNVNASFDHRSRRYRCRLQTENTPEYLVGNLSFHSSSFYLSLSLSALCMFPCGQNVYSCAYFYFVKLRAIWFFFHFVSTFCKNEKTNNKINEFQQHSLYSNIFVITLSSSDK